MKGRFVLRIAFCITACLAMVIPAAQAQVDEGMFLFEIYGGNYGPGPDDLDDESTFGVRFGGMLSGRVVLIGTVGRVEFDGNATDGMTSIDWNSDITLLDVTLGYVFRADKRFAIALGGGIGGAITSFDGELQTPNLRARFEDLAADSFTLNVVVGPVIGLSPKIYLKPILRARWFEVREDDEVDIESSLALGFKW